MRLRRIEPVVRRALRGPCAVPPGSRVLVAVSGGADSTALLLALDRMASELDLDVAVAHLDHGLRAESAADLEFVRDLCARLARPLHASRWNTKLRMKRRGLSGQEGLRRLRREFLLQCARRTGAYRIATAHTADDQLETLLMRLMRGTGLRGLSGMHPRRGLWIKPLLEATRADIEADLVRAGERWREDASNLSLDYARNRVRAIVVPALAEALGGAAGRSGGRPILARHAQRLASEALETRRAQRVWIERALSGAWRIQGKVIHLDSSQVRHYPVMIQRTLLERLWRRAVGPRPGLTHKHLADLVKLLSNQRAGASIALPGGRVAVQDRGGLRIGSKTLLAGAAGGRGKAPKRPSWKVTSRWVRGDRARHGLADKPADIEYFAAEGIQGGLELRAARADEPFIPFGRRQAVRLGTFLSRQRIAAKERSHPTVLADAEGILWVIGVRRSARAPLTAETKKALRVHAELP